MILLQTSMEGASYILKPLVGQENIDTKIDIELIDSIILLCQVKRLYGLLPNKLVAVQQL